MKNSICRVERWEHIDSSSHALATRSAEIDTLAPTCSFMFAIHDDGIVPNDWVIVVRLRVFRPISCGTKRRP